MIALLCVSPTCTERIDKRCRTTPQLLTTIPTSTKLFAIRIIIIIIILVYIVLVNIRWIVIIIRI